MDRHVKGVDVRGTVVALKMVRRSVPLPPLSPSASALLEQRILASSWYMFEPFRELTATLHQVMFRGADEGAVEMGKLVARQALEGVHAPFIAHGNLQRVLDSMGTLWKTHYDFGGVVARARDAEADVWVINYADAPRWHGLLIAGWITEALKLAGAQGVEFDLRTGPWEKENVDIEIGVRWIPS